MPVEFLMLRLRSCAAVEGGELYMFCALVL